MMKPWMWVMLGVVIGLFIAVYVVPQYSGIPPAGADFRVFTDGHSGDIGEVSTMDWSWCTTDPNEECSIQQTRWENIDPGSMTGTFVYVCKCWEI